MRVVIFMAKGSIYQSFVYTVRSFGFDADDMYLLNVNEPSLSKQDFSWISTMAVV